MAADLLSVLTGDSIKLDYPLKLGYPQSFPSIASSPGSNARPSGRNSVRRKSSAQSIASMSSTSSSSRSGNLRLAEVAKQHCMGIHTEAWREDILPVRQYLPLQHIVSSLKRDRDEEAKPPQVGNQWSRKAMRPSGYGDDDNVAIASPTSDDSFLHMLNVPKRRRTVDSSQSGSPSVVSADSHSQFSYQAPDRASAHISRSALPRHNHALASTLTPDERDIFSKYALPTLQDAQILMDEVIQLNDQIVDEHEEQHDDDDDDDTAHVDNAAIATDAMLPVMPSEREIEVGQAFDEFIDFNDSKRCSAKI